MSINEYDKANIQQILIDPQCTWFTAQLLRLIAKADPTNRERIRIALPEEVAAFEAWEKQQ